MTTTTSTTAIENEDVTHVVIGQMVYGKGETLDAARSAFIESGGTTHRSHTIIDFSHPALRFTGIGAMGDVFWESDEDDIEPDVTYN